MTGIGIVGVVLVVAVVVVVLLVLLGRARAAEDEARAAIRVLAELQAGMPEREKAIRKAAIAQSRSVVTGKVAEQFVPFIEGFGLNPRDLRFIGSPIDFVCFEGLSEGKLARVVLIEVKSGKSGRLTTRERAIRDAIDRGAVAFRVCHVGGRGEVRWVKRASAGAGAVASGGPG